MKNLSNHLGVALLAAPVVCLGVSTGVAQGGPLFMDMFGLFCNSIVCIALVVIGVQLFRGTKEKK